jgi:hypothetical protein
MAVDGRSLWSRVVAQMRSDGLAHFSDGWNLVQLVGYGLQFAVDVVFALPFNPPASAVRLMSSFSVCLLFAAMLFYARGVSHLGPIVSMILQIVRALQRRKRERDPADARHVTFTDLSLVVKTTTRDAPRCHRDRCSRFATTSSSSSSSSVALR